MVTSNSDKKKDELKNYVNYLLSKGQSKEQIKKDLLDRGFNRFLVREVIYPNLKLLVYSGIVLICMILIIGWVYFFGIIGGKNFDLKPIAKVQILKNVGGIEVENVEIREENGMGIIEVYLVNTLDEDYDAPIDIRATSGDSFLTWIEPRGIVAGGTLKSSAPGFRLLEKTVKVSLNSEEIYEEVFVFA